MFRNFKALSSLEIDSRQFDFAFLRDLNLIKSEVVSMRLLTIDASNESLQSFMRQLFQEIIIYNRVTLKLLINRANEQEILGVLHKIV